ncbi:hypothetical protein [Pseudomonas capsici]|uniref:hypothetical protein n=1 Tax=Pseudomonas capsici TaxID=2810614 RepID=UPI000E3EBCE0|nr:hypothetical protein [Pseudomonas capsici]MCV4286260.1 hypothetical protein [Pseudomonas capsici]
MKQNLELYDLRNLLFIFDIDYSDDTDREEIIVSKNVNSKKELAELFDIFILPDFLSRPKFARDSLIKTLTSSLEKDVSFNMIFDSLSTYFDDEIEDQRQFMEVLLECLVKYEKNAQSSNS